MKRIIFSVAGLAALVCLLLAVLAGRTMMFKQAPAPATVVQAGAASEPVDTAAVTRLAEAVRVPTISYFDSTPRLDAFRQLHAVLARGFPLVHQRLTREVVDSGALLFTWRGTDTTLAPALLMAHMDVVPVEPGTEKKWEHGPFSGDVAGGYVWGRGTMDDKVNVMAELESVEGLLRDNFQPKRTVILSFGFTEEVGGPTMPKTVALLRQRGVHPEFVLDEGGIVADSLVPGVPGRVALIGVAEKGYVTLRLTAKAEGGHSSMPPRETAVGELAEAITKLERSPMPARIDGASEAMLEHLAPYMPFSRRMVMANLWLFRPALTRMLSSSPSGNAMVRTTTAPTMLQGSVKDNVLPSTATAMVNFRILPGDSVSTVIRHVRQAIGDDRVAVDTLSGLAFNPSRVSPDDAPGYAAIARSIGATFPGVLVSPYLVVGATDSRYFAPLTSDIYRFSPYTAGKLDLERVHGTNERVSASDYLTGVAFYRRLVKDVSAR